jgi:hypothetical protein
MNENKHKTAPPQPPPKPKRTFVETRFPLIEATFGKFQEVVGIVIKQACVVFGLDDNNNDRRTPANVVLLHRRFTFSDTGIDENMMRSYESEEAPPSRRRHRDPFTGGTHVHFVASGLDDRLVGGRFTG